MRRIRLSQGKYATVDDSMYDQLAQFKWCCNSRGYAVRGIRNAGSVTAILMHRFILELVGIKIPAGFEVDHIDGSRRNNQLKNLRLATRSQQRMNSKKPANNTSGLKGVYWHKSTRKWRAEVQVNNSQIHLGHYDSKHKAAAAYRKAAKKYFGEFMRAA